MTKQSYISDLLLSALQLEIFASSYLSRGDYGMYWKLNQAAGRDKVMAIEGFKLVKEEGEI